MLNLHNLSEEISNAQIEKASRIGEVSMRLQAAPTMRSVDSGCACLPHFSMLPMLGAITGIDSHLQIEASTRSTNKSFKKLVADKLATPEEIYKTICNQTVDLVFTAHPTQVWEHHNVL